MSPDNIASGLRNMVDDIEKFGAAPLTVDTSLLREAISALTAPDGWVSPDDLLEAQDRAFYDGMSKCACPVPDGFVLVQVEPTEAMLHAMYGNTGRDDESLKEMWAETLAARPEAK